MRAATVAREDSAASQPVERRTRGQKGTGDGMDGKDKNDRCEQKEAPRATERGPLVLAV